jgi:hypothetical protein
MLMALRLSLDVSERAASNVGGLLREVLPQLRADLGEAVDLGFRILS